MQNLIHKIKNHGRLDAEEALHLVHEAPLYDLARLARDRCYEKTCRRVAYLIDRNINYTNVCTARCHFCAFYRPHHHKQSYDLSYAEIDKKIGETLALGGHRILMQGGLHPQHTVQTYVDLVHHIHTHHAVHIHAFSPPEIHHVATKSGQSYKQVLKLLKDAGLQSMPGGGAEILVDAVREQIMTGKCNSTEWLAVMQASHENGIPSTATMMLGHIETWRDRIEHLDRLRTLQDKTGGFLSFIPWTYQPENTPMNPQKSKKWHHVRLASAYEYLRFLALSRLYLDNFDHIQVSLLTQGAKVAQIGLHFGADDLGSILIEENVVRMAGCDQEGWDVGKDGPRSITVKSFDREANLQLEKQKQKMRSMITEAGCTPYERDTFYKEINQNL